MTLFRFLLLCFLSCSSTAYPQEVRSVSFSTAPEFSLRDINGKKVSLSDYKGKVVLINFWATWCAPCIYEIPHLQKIYKDLKAEGFIVLGINVDEARNFSGIKPLSKKLGIKYPVLIDRNRSVISMYNPSMVLPYTVIINTEGEIYAYFEGYYSGSENEIRKAVEEAIDFKR